MKYGALILFMILALFCSCNAFEISSSDEEKVFIVAVGIDYTNSLVSNLQGTVADASETALCLSDIYTSCNIETKVLLMIQNSENNNKNSDMYPDSQNIINTLKGLDVSENDLIIFYFSGHGEKDERGSYAAGAATSTEEFSKLYLNDLCNVLNDKPCRSLVILDCCYAGNAADFSLADRDLSTAVKTMFSTRKFENKVSVIASCNRDQNSVLSSVVTQEGNFENHSLFTAKMLNSLGWIHTNKIKRNFYNISVLGQVVDTPPVMTLEELYREITGKWSNTSQLPIINRTDIPLLLIPYKR